MVALAGRPAARLRVLVLTVISAVLAALVAAGPAPATADMVDKVSFDPVAGDAVRLRIPATRFGGQNPKLAELAVSG